MNTNELRLYTRIINFVVNEQYQLNVNVTIERNNKFIFE